MQFTTTAALALISAASTISAAPLTSRTDSTTTCPVTQEGDYVWKISEFFSRQPNGIGKGISALGFNIKATNGGTLDFNCASSKTVEDNTFYPCGETSFISFAWSSDRNGLLIKQGVSDDVTYIGTTTLPNYCRAGGAGPQDFVCDGVSDAYITLVPTPKA